MDEANGKGEGDPAGDGEQHQHLPSLESEAEMGHEELEDGVNETPVETDQTSVYSYLNLFLSISQKNETATCQRFHARMVLQGTQ